MKPETAKALNSVASLAELVAEARAAVAPNLQIGRPANSITAKEYANNTGFNVSTSMRHLNELVASGKYEIITAVAQTANGYKICQQKFYRKVSNAKVDSV